MKKRIFQSICLACVITLFLTTACIVSIIYNNSTKEVKKELINQTIFISKAIELNIETGSQYIAEVGKESESRITLISPDGAVLYDNFVAAHELENHLDRPEIQAAAANGKGEDTRLSDTLGDRTYYYAVKLDNGDILRVAATGKTALGLMNNAIIWIIFIALSILIISVIAARFITYSIVSPINELDLNKPLSNDSYDELSPLLSRLEKQNQKIASQLHEFTAQQQEFDYITGAMSEGLVIFSGKGMVLSANNSAKTILGNAAGKSYLELCRDMNYIKAIESALSGKSLSVKMSKNAKTYQLSANPVEGKSYSYAAVLFIVDITDREEAEKIRREFSANVSHELKTPLTSIMGYAEIIENGIAKKDDIPRFANQIHSEAARLLTLIEDIIRLSRLDEGDSKPEFEEIELCELCKSVIGELSEKARGKNVEISFEGVPSSIYGIKSLLHEMIYNLCDNAINYNKENGSVTVKLLKDNGKTKLSVTDTGIGIASEHLERIFERFYRADKSHSKDTGGTGLGLSIVKHTAFLHAADINVESQENKGTTITVTFNNENSKTI